MRIIKLLAMLALFASCQQENADTNKIVPGMETSAKKNSLRLYHLLGDGFLKGSFLSVTQDTISFIRDDYYEQRGIHQKILFYFNKSSSTFIYKSSAHQELSKDSLGLLRNTNILPKILKEARDVNSAFYNELVKAKSSNSKLNIINKDSRIGVFANNYYIVNGNFPDSLYQVSFDKKRVKVFPIEGGLFDAMNILLFDLDKDGNPEIILFQENTVPQGERLMYDIFSLRYDSIRVEHVNQ